MPLDALITGRIATLAGDAGFGWVEAIGVRAGRVAFAGTAVDLETRADPHTERIELEPDEVAIPGLTDAHLHLAQAALATRHIDLSASPTLDDGLRRIGAAHRGAAAADPAAWIQGHGWDSDRWGGWPTADDLEGVAPGRRIAIWAHDHHALWVSHAALRTAGVAATTDDPAGGIVRRDAAGSPEGVLMDAAARLVTVHIPLASDADLAKALIGCRAGTRRAGHRGRPRPRVTRAGSRSRLLVPGLRPSLRHGPATGPGPRVPARRRPRDRAGRRSSQRRHPGLGSEWPRAGGLAEVLRRRIDGVADRAAAGGHRTRAGPAAAAGRGDAGSG